MAVAADRGGAPRVAALRRNIDDIDDVLRVLLLRRGRIVAQVLDEKRRHGLPLRDAAREAEILAEAVGSPDSYNAEQIRQVFRHLFSAGTSSLGHRPSGRWEFDAGVVACFDDMLQRSIPQYDVMRELVTQLAARHVTPSSDVVDLGCSRGEALSRVMESVPRIAGDVGWVGFDVSDPMLSAARARFEGTHVRIEKHDLREGLPLWLTPSVVMAVLTLQFVPVNHRARVLADARRALSRHGCLIVVEKIQGETADIDQLLVEAHHRHKAAAGYSDAEIRAKALALENVLVPLSAAENERLLRAAGFRAVERFWQALNFAGWIARP